MGLLVLLVLLYLVPCGHLLPDRSSVVARVSVLMRYLNRVVEASLKLSVVCLLWCRELSSEEVGFLMPPAATVVVDFLEVLVQLVLVSVVSKYLLVVVVVVASLLVVVVVVVAFVLGQRVGLQPGLVVVLSLLRVGVPSLMVILLFSFQKLISLSVC